VELRGLDEGVQRGGDLGAAARLRAEVIAAPDDGSADAALGGVVVEWDACVVDEADQLGPVAKRVRSCLADRQRGERDHRRQPLLELVEHAHGFAPAKLADACEITVGLTIS
jgi:hypothetical protein